VVTVLVAAVLAMEALPFSPEPPIAPQLHDTCWFEPLDLCNTGGTSSPRLAEIPVLPPEAVRMACDSCWRPAFSAGPGRLPEGFAPPVERPPRRPS
jgi:hypothetical protein